MAEKLYCIRKTLRLMPREAKILKEKADAAGLCEAAYLRLLISQKPHDYPEIRELLKQLINEINAIGVNINQIAKNNNSTLYRAEDKVSLMAYMRKLNVCLKEVVEQIGNQ